MINNVDDAFDCEYFCAVLKHSERFNTGVMLVSPQTALFNDMMTQVHVLPSYTGGEEATRGTNLMGIGEGEREWCILF